MRLNLSRFSRRRLAAVAVGVVAVSTVAVLPALPGVRRDRLRGHVHGQQLDREPRRRWLHRQYHGQEHRRPVDRVDPALHAPQWTVRDPGLVGRLDLVRHRRDRPR